ncbi:hypothetical protein [Natronococcus jeotgali]|uniref:Uncharacterized protein n=1 Tax=Natronococcus jeotgali DSM 18795 TaxID=1227498 RepID=L9WXM2_9EURY|nr:hypothetical protein [Natronococcus jeotgali]ELY53093.1 hypothetical protein C492_18579 [Natronococcus jeotgali DSM 18795]
MIEGRGHATLRRVGSPPFAFSETQTESETQTTALEGAVRETTRIERDGLLAVERRLDPSTVGIVIEDAAIR